MSLDELLKAANELDEPELDRLIHQVAVLRVSRKSQVLPEEEAQLLQQINQGIPTDLRAQYQVLRAKCEAETLTEPEHHSLIQMSCQIEQLGAQRLEAMATLAQLRQVSLTELMQSLGIQPATYV
jgi:ERCC4-type nuclease